MSQVLWQHLGHLPRGNNEFQTTSIHQKSTWVKYRDIHTIDEQKLLGLLHLNEIIKQKQNQKLNGDSQPLPEAVGCCVHEGRCGPVEWELRGFELWRRRWVVAVENQAWRPTCKVVNVDSQCEILSIFTWVRMSQNWFDDTCLNVHCKFSKARLRVPEFLLILMIYTEKNPIYDTMTSSIPIHHNVIQMEVIHLKRVKMIDSRGVAFTTAKRRQEGSLALFILLAVHFLGNRKSSLRKPPFHFLIGKWVLIGPDR